MTMQILGEMIYWKIQEISILPRSCCILESGWYILLWVIFVFTHSIVLLTWNCSLFLDCPCLISWNVMILKVKLNVRSLILYVTCRWDVYAGPMSWLFIDNNLLFSMYKLLCISSKYTFLEFYSRVYFEYPDIHVVPCRRSACVRLMS